MLHLWHETDFQDPQEEIPAHGIKWWDKVHFKDFTLLSGSYRESFMNNLEPAKEENIFFTFNVVSHKLALSLTKLYYTKRIMGRNMES